MLVLGVDPGMSGAICLRDDESVILEVMPIKDGNVDIEGLHQLLRAYSNQVTRAFLEMASLRRGQQGQFKIGRNFGRIESVLEYLKIPTAIIRPQEWSKKYAHGVTEKDKTKRYRLIKKSRRKIAERIYPGINFLASEKSSIPHDGLVDSALISDYGWNILKPRRGIQ